jgi:hypothetical protein
MKRKNTKQEITLMTLLANESASESRKLLKKYNKPDAKNCADLEVKLAQLYFDAPDKLAIEKELAEIHPHKEWILKRTKVEEVEKPVEVVEAQKTSSAEGDCCNPYCPVHGKCIPTSNFDDFTKSQSSDKPKESRDLNLRSDENNRMNSYQSIVPIIGLVAVVGFMAYLLKSNK